MNLRLIYVAFSRLDQKKSCDEISMSPSVVLAGCGGAGGGEYKWVSFGKVRRQIELAWIELY